MPFCHGAMTKRRTLQHRFEYSAAHDSEVRAELPLRPSARAAPPSAPSSLKSSLRAKNVFAFLSAGADTNANTWGGSALQRAHGAALEPLAQRSDALSSVVSSAVLVDAAELVSGQAASTVMELCQRALTQQQTMHHFVWGLRSCTLQRGNGRIPLEHTSK